MSGFDHDVDAVLAGSTVIPREQVLAWIREAKDLPTLLKLYRLTGESYDRIRPELGQDATCSVIQRYLLECIRQNVHDSEDIEGRWDAAATLHAWLCHLAERKDTSQTLRNV